MLRRSATATRLPELGRGDRGLLPAGSGADHQQVVVVGRVHGDSVVVRAAARQAGHDNSRCRRNGRSIGRRAGVVPIAACRGRAVHSRTGEAAPTAPRRGHARVHDRRPEPLATVSPLRSRRPDRRHTRAARLRATRRRWWRCRSAAPPADGSGSRCASTCRHPSTSPRRPRTSSAACCSTTRPPSSSSSSGRAAMPGRPPSSSSSGSWRGWPRTASTPVTRSGRSSTAAGSRWRCYDECGCTGLVPRSSTSPLWPRPRAEGRVVRADRTELERLVAPVDERVLRRREALARRGGRRGGRRLVRRDRRGGRGVVGPGSTGAAARRGMRSSTARAGGPHPASRRMIEGDRRARRGLDAARCGRPPPPPTARRARQAPTTGSTTSGWWRSPGRCRSPWCATRPSPPAPGRDPAAAEALWAALTRGTPDPEAAEPAALLALMGLLHGDGALANVALQRAEAAWPGHRFTATLRGLAAAGIRPSELRACLTGAPVPRRDRSGSRAAARTRRARPGPTRRRRAPPMTVATTDAAPPQIGRRSRRGAGRRDGRPRRTPSAPSRRRRLRLRLDQAPRRSWVKRQASPTIVVEVGAGGLPAQRGARPRSLEATSTAGSPPRRGATTVGDRVPGHARGRPRSPRAPRSRCRCPGCRPRARPARRAPSASRWASARSSTWM